MREPVPGGRTPKACKNEGHQAAPATVSSRGPHDHSQRLWKTTDSRSHALREGLSPRPGRRAHL